MALRERDLAATLDPREILVYLNELGIRNVSGEMLKEFIRDLKKLIRLDQQIKKPSVNIENRENFERFGPERLHSCSTFSSRSKCVKTNERRRPLSSVNIGKDIQQNSVSSTTPTVCKRVCSAGLYVGVKKSRTAPMTICINKDTPNIPNSGKSSNLIKVPLPERPKKSDPVSLYHRYNALWEKYKANLPGENSWADLRWSVRERLAGVIQDKPKTVMKTLSKEMLAKRREGWTDQISR